MRVPRAPLTLFAHTGTTGTPAPLNSASNDDLLLGAPSPLSPNPAKMEAKDADFDDKDSSEQGNGAVKANKGMILKKSVEYIR